MKALALVKSAKFIFCLFLTLFSVIVFTACGKIEDGVPAASATKVQLTSGSNQSSQLKVIHIEPSYIAWYTDLGSLKRDAKVVAEGTIIKVNPAVDGVPYAYTTSVLNINNLISDSQKLVQGQTLEIRQIGGKTATAVYQVADNPLFQEGDQVVLFLEFDSTEKVFYVIGGPSGRFEVKNGEVSPATSNGLKLDNHISDSEFLSQIKTQAILPQSTPVAVPPSPTIVRSGQTVNLSKIYNLDKAQSIFIKSSSKGANITDTVRVNSVTTLLNKPLTTVDIPTRTSIATDMNKKVVIFIFADNKTVDFNFIPSMSIFVSNQDNNMAVKVPMEVIQALDL